MEQHILFKAGKQTFALPITQTDRIIALENETRVPDLSSYIIGVQDIEGEVIVIVDLADRFYALPNQNPADAEIILAFWKESKVGLLVDEVTTVQAYDTSDLMDKDAGKADGLSTSYITAFIQAQDEIIPILDPHSLFSADKAEEMRDLVSIHTIKE
ncbi:CheW-like domain-containing protein [Alkalibacterium subtropicum]|uniref:CheW-like domain-containing protein n=1 Tax=Alkalibacterium subtropicum TaxID=753702 RepID=A0A1I1ISR6_9LACT|nr:chemotaxis protein CheW [Alkalibacterium subtropicum]SFC39266.1 CheW-like domain-containing protein [Alkalibacterium subtropicum]